MAMTDNITMRKVDAIHHQNREGLRELSFYQYELNVMDERMRAITEKNTTHEIIENVAGFRECLIKLQREVDQLNNDFTNEDFKLAVELQEKGKAESPNINKAWQLHGRLLALQDEIQTLRNKVNSFLSRVM